MAALDYLKSRGLLAKVVTNKLHVFPKEKISLDDRKYISQHRMEMLAELAANDGMEQRTHWKIFRDGIQICVITGGPMSQEDALQAARAHWPDAEARA